MSETIALTSMTFEFEKAALRLNARSLTGESRGTVGGLLNGFRLGAKGMALAKLAEQDLGVAADDMSRLLKS